MMQRGDRGGGGSGWRVVVWPEEFQNMILCLSDVWGLGGLTQPALLTCIAVRRDRTARGRKEVMGGWRSESWRLG
ncbi:hypothetical protein E2C01_012187 [Portunus trituberculatus]|uniref:Uncharacterized protein n=1 Tax=Portunus trituberculatus TaxID=210409 RepID=A0A5B7DDV5_PORTR|nr:hypothetical protein [Portunus trituberculatus]